MSATSLRTRVAPLLAWSSPVLVLVLLFGFHQSPTTRQPTLPSAPSGHSSNNALLKNGMLRTPLASVVRGTVGSGDQSVTVPLTPSRPVQLTLTPATRAVLHCGATSRAVSLVVVAPSDGCSLELSTAALKDQPWTIRVLP